MKYPSLRLTAALVAVVAAGVCVGVSAGAPQPKNSYVVHNLTSDQPGVADHVSPNLVNAWGLAALPTSPWWIADNGKDVSTVYDADGTLVPPLVSVPSAPTGLVANTTGDFPVPSSRYSYPALFLFDTEDGAILGWNSYNGSNPAVVVVPPADGAVFKGLAIASTQNGSRLYAADFHNGRVDVFDGNFAPVNVPDAFVDPKLPRHYAPFGIQNIGGNIFVSYAKQDADRHDDVAGHGNGFVDEYDSSGMLIRRVASRGQLNSPWGLAMAPASFGRFGGELLVGNFGDGRITAYREKSNGKFDHPEQLKSGKKPLAIDGLWSLQFGLGDTSRNGPTDTLFFTAGPDHESHGLFGTITAG